MEKRTHQQTPTTDDQQQATESRQQRGRQHRHEVATAHRQHSQEEQQRRDHQVLKQKHRKHRAPCGRAQTAALRHHGDDDRGRRQGEAGSEYERGPRRLTERQGESAQHEAGGNELRAAQPKDQPAQARQALPRQFEPDREEQEDDTELGDRLDIADLVERDGGQDLIPVRERAEPVRPQHRAGAEEADDRAELEAPKQGHDETRREQKQQRFLDLFRREIRQARSSASETES